MSEEGESSLAAESAEYRRVRCRGGFVFVFNAALGFPDDNRFGHASVYDRWRVLTCRPQIEVAQHFLDNRLRHGLDLRGESADEGVLADHVDHARDTAGAVVDLSLIHISEPTRLLSISYAVF